VDGENLNTDLLAGRAQALALVRQGFAAVSARPEVFTNSLYEDFFTSNPRYRKYFAAGDEKRRDERTMEAATRVVAQAVQRAHEGHAGLEVGGSAIGGLPDDVLIELSHVVDLLVIGDDSHDPLIARKITTRVQAHAHCPLVCVPRDYFPPVAARPITVVADDRGLLEPVLAFATSLARRAGVGLQVSRAWSSLHEGRVNGPGWLAEQQEELDVQLAGWRGAHPDVPVVARLELGYSWLDRLRAASSILVTSTRSVDLVRSPGDPVHSCPVAIVPE